MERLGRIALQGSSRGLLSPLLLFVLLITTSGIPAQAADGQPACRSPIARVVSIQGSVELLQSGSTNWTRVTRLDAPVCPGDQLRTGAQSRAALFVQPETLVRVDQNTSAIFSQSAQETLVEFTQEEVLPVAESAHACGAGYFITRFPRKFKVRTPHLSAAVEGTEFLVAMRCESTDLSVFEGKVLAASAGTTVFPAQSVVSGQTLTIGGTEPPAIKLLIKPADAVQWTLYYPPITPADATPVEDCSDVTQDLRPSCLIARAERLLRAGRVDEAQINISNALAVAPYSSDAKALSSIISLVRNDKVEALRLAREAVDATPDSAPAWLALSYAQQADFKLESALTSAQRAAELTPSSALALARVAELQLSLGWTREAEKTAKQAVATNPSESRAHMILGFVHLAQIKVKEAREDFERAIELDSTEPLARLGLGLAIIRKGNLVEGREQIEIAVALEPTSSLLRSYVGKAYYEENTKERDALASTQFVLAKQLDPNDPTPWFYDAIREQTDNRPGGSLEDLQKSIELNDNRAVYRSRLLLDQDSAARSAALARIYEQLGFGQVALTEGMRSVNTDPSNFSAHRFLADSYSALLGSEIARVSEVLQAELLQPINAPPFRPQLAQSSLLVLDGAGPATSSFQEFTPLFERNRTWSSISAVAGSDYTRGDEIQLGTTQADTSISMGQFHYKTDGFRTNDDYRQDVYNIFMQHSFTERFAAQAEFRQTQSAQGDVTLRFDPNDFLTNLRNNVNTESGRLGFRYSPTSDSDWIASFVGQGREDRQIQVDDTCCFPLTFRSSTDVKQTARTGEIQFQHRDEAFNAIAGAGLNHDNISNVSSFQLTLPDGTKVLGGPLGLPYSRSNNANAYAYGNLYLSTNWTAVLGLSFDSHHDNKDPILEREQFDPKLGLIWQPQRGTFVKSAWFRTLKRTFVDNQSIEPTQVAGFQQFFDDVEGTDSKRYGLGVDQRFSDQLFGGFELTKRSMNVPGIEIDPAGNAAGVRRDWGDRRDRAYLSWLPTRTLALDVSYLRLLEFRGFLPGQSDVPVRLDTYLTSVAATYQSPGGFFVRISPIYVIQKIELPNAAGDTTSDDEKFWVFNASVGYRFGRGLGIVSVDANNLLDTRFRFQDTSLTGDPRPPLFQPTRSVFVKGTIVFQ